MSDLLRTDRLQLTMRSLEATKAWVAELPPEIQREISPLWLARLNNATEPTPWICGFVIHRLEDGVSIGSCAFKAPPENGIVEIAYGIEDNYQKLGYATEAVIALTRFALQSTGVDTVYAHTKEDNFASIRVLQKAGFQALGKVIDPEDGEVLRFEKLT